MTAGIEASKATALDPRTVEWDKLIEEALTMPGSLGTTYCRFYNYSFLNQILLYMQGVNEPVNTYNRWHAMGRQVQKGSRAKSILRPLPYTVTNEKGEKESRIKGFKMINCLFTVSETSGADLPPVEPQTWDKAKALGALAIVEVPFEHLVGNTQGYSFKRNVAINPVAAYPVKTLFHELGHVVLGHTDPDSQQAYAAHRGVMEFQAESVAYLAMNELELTESMDMDESRAYIQGWLRHERPVDADIKPVFSTVDHILKAGRP